MMDIAVVVVCFIGFVAIMATVHWIIFGRWW